MSDDIDEHESKGEQEGLSPGARSKFDLSHEPEGLDIQPGPKVDEPAIVERPEYDL